MTLRRWLIPTILVATLWSYPGGSAPTVGNTGGYGGFTYDGTTLSPNVDPTTADFCVGGTSISTPAAEFCVDGATHNVTTDGSVTATEGFVVPPDLNDGGGISLSECEGGTGCDSAGAGETLTIKLPDNKNPMTASRSISPGYKATWYIRNNDLDSYKDGTYCIPSSQTGLTPDSCATIDDSGFVLRMEAPHSNNIWVNNCVVWANPSDAGTWDDNDVLVFQLQHVAADDAAQTNFGNKFYIMDELDTCSGECMNIDDRMGTWDVHGETTEAGFLLLNITSDTTNPANALPLDTRIECYWF